MENEFSIQGLLMAIFRLIAETMQGFGFSIDIVNLGVNLLRAFFGIFTVFALLKMLHGYFLLKTYDGDEEAHHHAIDVLKAGAMAFVVCLVIASSIRWSMGKIIASI